MCSIWRCLCWRIDWCFNPEARMKGVTGEQVLMGILQRVAVPVKL